MGEYPEDEEPRPWLRGRGIATAGVDLTLERGENPEPDDWTDGDGEREDGMSLPW